MNVRLFWFLLLGSVSFHTLVAVAAPGDLDPTFGPGGKTTFFMGNCAANSAAVQADGKILVAGQSFFANNDFTLIRFLADGGVDTDFGTSGKVLTDFTGGSDSITRVIAQSDGTILAAGTAVTDAGRDFALARYLATGALDPTFDPVGMDGKVTTDFGMGNDDSASFLGVQTDGKILVAGYVSDGLQTDFGLVRYNANGTRDTSIGNSGRIITDFNGKGDLATCLAIQSDGKIILAGYAVITNNFDFALVRYNTDGTPDTSFGVGGKVTTDFNNQSQDFIQSVAVLGDGKIIVGGASGGNFVMARYLANGDLDTSFGVGGTVSTDFGSSESIQSLVVLATGKIVAGGVSGDDFAMACYRPDGTLDSSFGSGGLVLTDFAGGVDSANAIVIDSSNRILLAGSSSGSSNFALARYTGPLGRPIVTLVGKRKRVISRPKITLRGTTTANTSTIAWRLGKRTRRAVPAANGTWRFTAKPETGSNRITITALGPDGPSVPIRMKVIRRN